MPSQVEQITDSRIARSAILIRPFKLLSFHNALKKRKYRLLYSARGGKKPGPKGSSKEVIDAIQAGMARLRSLQTTAKFLIYTVTAGKRVVADCFSCRSRLEALIRQGQAGLGRIATPADCRLLKLDKARDRALLFILYFNNLT